MFAFLQREFKTLMHNNKVKSVQKSKNKNDLILPDQPCHNEFLQTMTQVFRWSKLIGIINSERCIWKLWGLIVLILYLAIEGEAIWKVIKALTGLAVDTTGKRSVSARLSGAMFYTASLLGLVQCWRMSVAWKDICKYWASIERVLSIKYVPPDAALKRKMYIIIWTVIFSTTLEHIFNILPSVDFHCKPSKCLRKYILTSHGFLLLEYEYYDVIGVPLLFMSILATIQWNLQDMLIVLTSLGLTSRYRRLNECVARVTERDNIKHCEDSEFLKVYLWRKIREAYLKQAMLVRRVDQSLGGLIIISTFFNFYFVCLQLFLGITQLKDKSPLNETTYAVTMIWLLLRTGCALVAAADVNKHSTLALPYLYECNAQCYNVEIERLQKQLVNDYVALSGMGFFYLNRTVILQMCGAMVTYVLVLVQYDNTGPENSN